jgi:ribonuclease BN (tRNA processing enzyme)
MSGIYVADVGDGLCLGIATVWGRIVHTDCGSQDGAVAAFEGLNRMYGGLARGLGPDAFVLSHFHVDHYNGLLYASAHRRIDSRIREVYYPRLPEFKRKEDFLCALFAINYRVFGDETGLMEYDFLRAIARMNQVPFVHTPVSRGTVVHLRGSRYEVLWPPEVLEEGRTLSTIEKALDAFDQALEEDQNTRRLYDLVREEGTFWAYLGEGTWEREPERTRTDQESRGRARGALPFVVKRANESLRRAANHLSLAFFENSALLFLGDTESSEIRQIVRDLRTKHRTDFLTLIPAHHGTHWHKALRQVRCVHLVSSVGRRLCSRCDPNSGRLQTTLLPHGCAATSAYLSTLPADSGGGHHGGPVNAAGSPGSIPSLHCATTPTEDPA